MFVIPAHDALGRLPPGVHVATWAEITHRFGTNRWRQRLLHGLREALVSLKAAGCAVAYIDGSFVTACWDERGVDPHVLDPVLLDFSNRRAAQKARFGGELFPASVSADTNSTAFLNFFQIDKATGDQKGIIAIDLTRWQP